MRSANHLVWIDLEMTGLDPERHVIIEIASLVTNADLDVVAEGPVLAISRGEAELAEMDAWNVRTHTASGLVERIRTSAVPVGEAEARTLAFLEEWVPRGVSPLCGNSIAQDRRFLRREMPGIDEFLHYRQIDVSSVKELVRRWYPRAYEAPQKREAHRALDDIHESVAELRWYRERIFAPPGGSAGVAPGEPSPLRRLADRIRPRH